MTISSTTRTAGPFTGNGAAYLFPFAFKVFTAADLFVASSLIASGVQTTLALGTDHTVALNANQNSNPGGAVILTAGPLADGYRLAISSDLANLQPTEFINQGGFYPEVLTASLDRATILVQQLQDELDRSLQFPITDPPTNNTLPSAEIRAGLFLAFDVTGAPIAVAAAVSSPGSSSGPGAALFVDTGTGLSYTLQVINGALTPVAANVLVDSVTRTDYYALAMVSGAPELVPVGATPGAVASLPFTDLVTGIPYAVSVASGALEITEL